MRKIGKMRKTIVGLTALVMGVTGLTAQSQTLDTLKQHTVVLVCKDRGWEVSSRSRTHDWDYIKIPWYERGKEYITLSLKKGYFGTSNGITFIPNPYNDDIERQWYGKSKYDLEKSFRPDNNEQGAAKLIVDGERIVLKVYTPDFERRIVTDCKIDEIID